MNSGDQPIERYLGLCTLDVELISLLAPLEGPNAGVEGIREFFAGIEECANAFRIELERVHLLEDGRVVALTCVRAESKGGVAFSQAGANVYELEEGRLRRIRVYLRRDECLEAKAVIEDEQRRAFAHRSPEAAFGFAPKPNLN